MSVDYSKALKLAISCQESYQNFSDVNIKFSGWSEKPNLIEQKTTDTQLVIFTDKSETIIVFPGSNSSLDWRTNFETSQERKEFDEQVIRGEIVEQKEKIYPYPTKNSSGALMHTGFVTAYFSVRDQIHEYVRNNNSSNITVSGHSLGGALATLCVVDVQYNFANQLKSIESYTFGAPKVGNDGFVKSYNERITNSYQFVNGMDLIPELPRWWQGYRKVDKELRIGSRFSLNFISARFQDHGIANYINAIKKMLSYSGN